MALTVGGSFIATAASPLLQTAPTLGAASSFSVLGGSTVTNTGVTTVQGDLGVSPGTAVTGFPPGVITGGSIHAADALAGQAQADATTAYNNLAGQPCATNLTGQNLGGMVLVPGVYCFPNTSAQLTGALTLNSPTPDGVFIFQIGSTLTTASNASVLLIGGSACNVFWQVGTSATLGTGTSFAGNILALTSVSLQTNAQVIGRALARNGAVTMDTNSVGGGGCAVGVATPTATATTAAATATPVPVAPATATPAPVAPATSVPAPASPPSSDSGAPAPTAVLVPLATSTATSVATATGPAATAIGTPLTSPTAPVPPPGAVAIPTATTAAPAVPAAPVDANVAPAVDVAGAEAENAAPSAETDVASTTAPVTDVAGETDTAVLPTATGAAALSGRAGGLDAFAIAAGLCVLGTLTIGAGLVRRRRSVR